MVIFKKGLFRKTIYEYGKNTYILRPGRYRLDDVKEYLYPMFKIPHVEPFPLRSELPPCEWSTFWYDLSTLFDGNNVELIIEKSGVVRRKDGLGGVTHLQTILYGRGKNHWIGGE